MWWVTQVRVSGERVWDSSGVSTEFEEALCHTLSHLCATLWCLILFNLHDMVCAMVPDMVCERVCDMVCTMVCDMFC